MWSPGRPLRYLNSFHLHGMIGINAEYQSILLVFMQVAFETVLIKFTCIKHNHVAIMNSSMNMKSLRMMSNVITFFGTSLEKI